MGISTRAARKIRRGIRKALLDAPIGHDFQWMLEQTDPLTCEAYGRVMKRLVPYFEEIDRAANEGAR